MQREVLPSNPYVGLDEHDITKMNTIDNLARKSSSMSSSPGLKALHASDHPISVDIAKLDASLFEYGAGNEVKEDDFELDMSLPFPIKLHYILSNPKYDDCITWLPHGRSWKVLNQKRLENEVIPRYFRSEKFSSFMRQVNGWAFTRVAQGPDISSYYHDMFLRGIPNLCIHMKRPPKVKHAAAAARIESGVKFGAPDFDQISKLAPLPARFSFKPILKNRKGSASKPEESVTKPKQSHTITIVTDEVPALISLQMRGTNLKSKMQAGKPLSKADISYLKHQNKILLLHGGFPEKPSY